MSRRPRDKTGRLVRRLSTGLCGLLFLFVSPSGATLAAESGQALYTRANQAYFNQEWEEAETLYLALDEQIVPGNPAVWHNLGNCAYQLGAYGRAIYYYRLAAQHGEEELAGRATRNLAAARNALYSKHKKKIEKGIVRYDESHTIWYALFTLLSETTSLVLFLATSLPLFIALFVWTFMRRRPWPGVAKMVFLSLLAPALLFGTAYFGRVLVENRYRLGIVVAEEGALRDAPDPAAPSELLPEGLEVRILLRNERGFYKLELSDGRVGYALEHDVRPLLLDSLD